MPLFYMRAIFEANYSRKLASLKHRRVTAPRGSDLAAAQPPGCAPYWQWAFESPQHVKAIVRQELGEKLMPQVRFPRPAHAAPCAWPACMCLLIIVHPPVVPALMPVTVWLEALRM